MVDFITKDKKVIPINNEKKLSSSILTSGSKELNINKTDAQTLMSTKQGAFPDTNFKVGIQKAWREPEFLKAQEILYEIVEREIGHKLTDGGFFVTDTVNGEEIKSGFQIVPTGKKSASFSSSAFAYTGFRINLPREALNDFDRLKKFEEDNPDLEVKDDGVGSSFSQYFTVPATNPSKINLIAPLLNRIVEMGITGQAEKTQKDVERKQLKENRKTKIKSVHETVLSDLGREGFETPEKDVDPFVSEDGFRQSVSTRIEITPDSVLKTLDEGGTGFRDFVDVNSKIENNDGSISFSIDNSFKLNESQLIKILKIMKEHDDN